MAATEMVQLLRNVVSTSRWSTAQELMDLVRRVGMRVQAAQTCGVSLYIRRRRVSLLA